MLTIIALSMLLSCTTSRVVPGQYYRVTAIRLAPKFGCWVWYERLSQTVRIYHKKIPDLKVGEIIRLPEL